MAEQDSPTTTQENESKPQFLAGALDFLSPVPVFVTVQAYRDTAFDAQEAARIQEHLSSWRLLLAKHGVIYDGIMLDGDLSEFVDMIYHFSMAVDMSRYPAALPLVLDALYELQQLVPSAEWEVHVIEQSVTRLVVNDSDRGLVPGPRVFPQHVRGLPAPNESNGASY